MRNERKGGSRRRRGRVRPPKGSRLSGERRALLEEQERLRALAEMALGIAHDVNNVLTALRLRVGILLKDRACVDAQGTNLQAIDRIVREGATLLAKLQNFGSPGEAKIGPVDLDETICAAVEIAQSGLRLRAAETGVQVRIRCDLEPLPRVRGLREELRHVFVNLLVNARDAMPKGGNVVVRGRREDGGVVVTVEDEGTGIAPEHLSHVFDPFFTTKGDNGTGIGLAIARNVMDRIGSTICARNRPGGGACFELRFTPYQARSPRRPPMRAPGRASPAPS